jgi:hypothetical protein
MNLLTSTLVVKNQAGVTNMKKLLLTLKKFIDNIRSTIKSFER